MDIDKYNDCWVRPGDLLKFMSPSLGTTNEYVGMLVAAPKSYQSHMYGNQEVVCYEILWNRQTVTISNEFWKIKKM